MPPGGKPVGMYKSLAWYARNGDAIGSMGASRILWTSHDAAA